MTPWAGSRHTKMRPKITPGIAGRLEPQGLQANLNAAEVKRISHCYLEGPERPLFYRPGVDRTDALSLVGHVRALRWRPVRHGRPVPPSHRPNAAPTKSEVELGSYRRYNWRTLIESALQKQQTPAEARV